MPFSRLLESLLSAGAGKQVGETADRLKAVFGEDGFEAELDRTFADKALSQADIVAIASALGYKASSRASRKKNRSDILMLHRDLVTFRAKKRAMEGRSAA